jgi:methylglyoxal synthase
MSVTLPTRKRIALIAHDARKQDLLEWSRYNKDTLARHELVATGTTGTLLKEQLDLPITAYLSGPLGGDQQIGARIVEGDIHVLIFFWDPLEMHPHDPDVRALLRVAVLKNIPVATNRASADFLLTSPLLAEEYECHTYDYASRLQRERIIEHVQGLDDLSDSGPDGV